MILRRRSKPTPWTLRPGDALPERVLAKHPELRGIENNAAYRIMLHQHRVGLPMSKRRVILGCLFIAFLGIQLGRIYPGANIFFSSSSILFLVLLIYFAYFISFYYSNNPAKASKRLGLSYDTSNLLGLTVQNISDLISTATSPVDVLHALLAVQLRQAGFTRRRMMRWGSLGFIVIGVIVTNYLGNFIVPSIAICMVAMITGMDVGVDHNRVWTVFRRINYRLYQPIHAHDRRKRHLTEGEIAGTFLFVIGMVICPIGILSIRQSLVADLIFCLTAGLFGYLSGIATAVYDAKHFNEGYEVMPQSIAIIFDDVAKRREEKTPKK